MNENTDFNRRNDNDENVTINIPISDIQYSLYRKELIETANKLEADPNAYLSQCGIIIRSYQLDEFEYQMHKTTFGNRNNIINTLAFTLITILKSSVGTDKEEKVHVLRSFIRFFISAAQEEFFGREGFEESFYNTD